MRRLLLLLAIWAGPAYAGSNDIQREIKVQQSAANDLAALDTGKLVQDEIALLKTWLDEAYNRQAKDQNGRAREVLERCQAQSDLIRQKLAAAKAKAEADAHEKAARDARDKVQRTKKALDDATVKKKAMEMNAK
jgi:hypothetical protein